jgi:thiamine-monophosphate kinase
MFENKEKTTLNQLGEFGLIKHLTSTIEVNNESTKHGVGDDCAVLSLSDHQVVSTDMFVEHIHFDLIYTPLKHLGYKVVAAAVSDICAMNAIPSQITIALGISSKYTLEALEELYIGILSACKAYNADLVGGDTTSSSKGLILSVTAIGSAPKDELVYRNTAETGDLLCVTGDLGGAYCGLQILEREKKVFLEHSDMQPDLENKSYIVGRQLKPEARVDIKSIFKELGIKPTSMIDVSDGLSSEILHLSKESKVAFTVHEDKLPIDQQTYDTALELNLAPTTCALNGGEDYELLFTLPQKHYDKIKHSPEISVIGYCTPIEQGNKLVSKSGSVFELEAQGWQYFKND